MYLLAFESSCDDTSVALLRDEKLVAMATHTQSEHILTSGVVPEIAARLHADHIFDLITTVLGRGNITLADIDIYAATSEPGLIPSLLIGKTVAKTLAMSRKKPLIWVNHIEGHIFSILLDRELGEIVFPMMLLSASGGHNDLFIWKSLHEIKKIGGTLDDSAGESMDKVGRMLGFPFPAGRHIDALAQTYDSSIHLNIPKFPVFSPKGSDDFSFSGLKSAALREIQSRGVLNEIDTVEIAYAYQKTITDTLSHELIRAHEKYGTQSIGLVGGVSANTALRRIMQAYAQEKNTPYYTPLSLSYCGDNAAMIGIRAWHEYQKDDLKINYADSID